ncbi:pseudoazurin [Balneatrix alpica]|uniref:pseudoazurin n=1 Tax=Balneatrix alpica TaxID=75684 RepID=UPI00273959CA|nr:pseudoazurin [Balneatrix alpica]
MSIKPWFTALLLSSCTQSALAAEHIVHMKNKGSDGTMVFEPAVLKVAVGDTVHFEPSDPGHNAESIPALSPAGATGWKGEMGQKVSITLDKEGVYLYQCLPHSIMAMVGVIVAGEASNLAEIKANAPALSSTFVMNKDRLQGYLSQVQ